MICKLIDFGESYHYKVCGDHHRPKYTRLYASPEVVTSVNGRLFTEKSDVFSFGIMAHKIFFDRYPYFFRDQESFEKGNIDKNLREKTFYLP
jgi:serine/threonine protein kinase